MYQDSDGRSKEAWKSIIDDLRQKSDNLEDIIGSLQCNSFPDAIQRLEQLRADRFRSPQRKDSATSGLSSGPDGAPRDDNFHQARSISLDEQPFEAPQNDYDMRSLDYEYNSLPPQFLTRRAVSAFFVCGSTLFYVMQQKACEDLMWTIYERPADMTKSDTCGLCAVAAVGGLYCTDELPDIAHKEYFQRASLLLQDTVETNPLMGMRVSACLSVYLVLGKSISARTMTGQ